MKFSSPINYLDSFINYEFRLKDAAASAFQPERIREVLRLLGNPERQLTCLHVAGSKGKGSTCAFLASILRSAGYRVGLYTSPHLCDVNERIRVLSHSENRDPGCFIFDDCIADEELARVFSEIRPVFEQMRETPEYGRLTYYEVLTAAAFYFFDQEKVDFAVLETGLGGRLDATNVADADVCGITPVSFEHQAQLGPTLKDIAGEKAAIIKPSARAAVTSAQDPEALAVIRERCRLTEVKLIEAGKDFSYKILSADQRGTRFTVKGIRGSYDLHTRLLGAHQAANAAAAVVMAESLRDCGTDIDAAYIKEGAREARWPGRMEVLNERPLLIADGAHNPASARVLVSSVKSIFPERRVTLVCAFSDDKDIAGICREFGEIADEVILTKTGHPRCFQPGAQDAAKLFPEISVSLVNDAGAAVRGALQKAKGDDMILVAGSLYLVGEVKLCTNIKI